MPQKTSLASTHLDLLRGVAALEVFLGHLRQNTLVDHSPALSPLARLGFFATGFGHQAVMVFFVLSGYFIASSVMQDWRRERWSWSRYFVNRASRLGTVLIPALVLGAIWDTIGVHLLRLPLADSRGLVAPHLTLKTAIGNLFFLQGIWVESFGSNGPLWSLSYEAWYYVLFPLLVVTFRREIAGGGRLAAGLLFGVGLWMVGREIALYFLIWLLGAATSMVSPLGKNVARGALIVGGVSLLVSLLAVGSNRLASGFLSDSLVAIAFALLLLGITHTSGASPAPPRYARWASGLAGFSFTLYLAHFPPLLLARFALLGERRPVTAGSVGLGLGLGAALLLYCYVLARLTEAHTEAVRRWLSERLQRSSLRASA